MDRRIVTRILVAAFAAVILLAGEVLVGPPAWSAQNNTGVWTLGTNTANHVTTVGSNTTTATVAFSGHSTATTQTTLTAQTLNNIAVFSPAVQNTASLGIDYIWDTTPEGGTTLASTDGGTVVMTITFTRTVKDPIIHLDRIGGSDGAVQNSMVFTLQTGGITLTRLSGTPHFSVAGSTITNSQNNVAIAGGWTGESSNTANLGTAAGSVRLNGTFSTVSFLMAPATGTHEGAGGDAVELEITFDPVPAAADDAFNGYYNTTANGTLPANNGAGADFDFNNDALTITQVNAAAFTVGSPIALSNGSLTITNATTGTFSFTPTSGFFGTQTFTYTVSDPNGGVSTATVTINILRTTVTIQKTSNGAVGGFTFTGNNGWTSQTVTTVTTGVAVTGTLQTLTAPSIATTIQESIPSGYVVASISCAGLGSGGTATPTLATGTIVLDAAATASGSSILCSYTNTRLPTLRLTKISSNGVGAFTFTGNNGWASQTITTVSSGVGVNGAVQTLSAASTATTITEAIASGFYLTAVSCAGMGGGGTATPNLAAGTLSLNAAATAPGAVITCTFSNGIPGYAVSKSVNTATIAAPGTLTYTINVANTNTVVLTGLTISDALLQGATPLTLTSGPNYASGDSNSNGSIDPSETWTYQATYAVTQSNINTGGILSNTATYDTAQTSPVSSSAATTAIVSNPQLSVVKTSDRASPVVVNEVVTYTFVVTNTGNITINDVVINETAFNGNGTLTGAGNESQSLFANPPGDSTDSTPNNGIWSVLGPGDAITYTATYTVTQQDIDLLQ